MNKNDLFKSIGEIDEQTLVNAETRKKRKTSSVVIKLIAASLAVVVMVFGFLYFLPNKQPDSPLFVIIAQAAEGEWGELDMNHGFLNSVPDEYRKSWIPADVPTFSFMIEPSDWGDYESKYGQFGISLSYNNKTVDVADDHICFYHIYLRTGCADAGLYTCRYMYTVAGWFEEETNVIITITETNTGDILQKITLNVQPQQDNSTCKLTVTNIETHSK